MFPCEDSKTVSVCPYPEKRNHHSFINISPTLVIDTSMERSSRVGTSYSMETQKFEFISKKFKIDEIRFCPYPEKRNHPGFFNISPTFLIDTLMEMFS